MIDPARPQDLRPALGSIPCLLGQAGALPPGADPEAAGPHQGRAPLQRGAAQDAQEGVCPGALPGGLGWAGRGTAERSPGLLRSTSLQPPSVPQRILVILKFRTQNPAGQGTVRHFRLKILKQSLQPGGPVQPPPVLSRPRAQNGYHIFKWWWWEPERKDTLKREHEMTLSVSARTHPGPRVYNSL